MDIDQKRLDAAYVLCQRYAMELGKKIVICKTSDRHESLQNADYVINTAQSQGHSRMQEGWLIAQKYGYHFGGSLHIMHDESFWINFYQFRLMEDILKDILDVCPHAWYILVANPILAGLTYLKRKYPLVKILGLCQGSGAIYRIAETIGLSADNISYEAYGVNHFIWLSKLFYKGENALPLFDRWIIEKSEKYWETCGNNNNLGPKPLDLYRRFGMYPLGDTHSWGGGSWGYWYHTDGAVQRKWKLDDANQWKMYLNELKNQVTEIEQAAFNQSIKVTTVFPPVRSEELIIQLIEAISCDLSNVMIVNTINDGNYIPGVPVDFEVEIPAIINARGVHGIKTAGLPKPIMSYLLADRIAPVEMELQAYEKKDRNLLLSLIMMDPLTQSEKQAMGLLDDILALPFNEEIRNHYI